MGNSRVRGHGFTLVEVAVSIAILGSVIAALLVARARAVRAFRSAQERTHCARLAASIAAGARSDSMSIVRGRFSQPAGYEWEIDRQDMDDDTLPKGLRIVRVAVTPLDSESGARATLWEFSAELARKSEE